MFFFKVTGVNQITVSIPYRKYRNFTFTTKQLCYRYCFHPLQEVSKSVPIKLGLTGVFRFHPLQEVSKCGVRRYRPLILTGFPSLIGSIEIRVAVDSGQLMLVFPSLIGSIEMDYPIQKLRPIPPVSIPYRKYRNDTSNGNETFTALSFHPLQEVSKSIEQLAI